MTTSKFRFVPDFGERNIGKKRPTLYLFCWNAHRYENEPDHPAPKAETDQKTTQSSPTVVALKPSLPENSSFVFGQASFAPDQKTIFATGYEETFDGRRLGAVGCWNHPSAIFKLELPKELPADSEEITVNAHRLTPPELSARSPRVTDAASGEPYSTVWLANPIGGPHSSCTSLHFLRSDENQSKILVDYVFDPISQPGGFPGLYVEQLPSRPFLSLNPGIKGASHLVTHSFWGSRQTVLAISLLSCTNVQDLTPDPNHTWTVMGTDGKEGLLAVRSAINKPNELVEARFQTLKPVQDWKIIDKPQVAAWGQSVESSPLLSSPSNILLAVRDKLNTLEWSIHPVPKRSPTEVIVLRTTGQNDQPLVTIPHGGPHGTYTVEFNPSTVALALEGCKRVRLAFSTFYK